MKQSGYKYFILVFLLVFNVCSIVRAQIDLTSKVKPVYEGDGSTALSVYDTNPESPDGKYLCFIRFPNTTDQGNPLETAEVIIKDLKTGISEKIYDIRVSKHNGANAIWVNDSVIAFKVNHLTGFMVYDIYNRRSMFNLIDGELGHKSFNNVIHYSVCNYRSRTSVVTGEMFSPWEEGIYSFNILTGEKKQIITKESIIQSFISQNKSITDKEVTILHVEPNPEGTKIMFDYRHLKFPDKRKEELHGIVNADGTDARWIPVRPMHVVWFDNNTMFGIDTGDPEKKIFRYDLYGNKIELLGGTTTHAGTSPDRLWYAGESGYYGPEEDGFTRVYLYRKGIKDPVALLSEWTNNQMTWQPARAHVNPSFSADGKRVYFIRAVDNEVKFEAVFIDLSEVDLSQL